jgi:hypothetical protein
MADGQFIQIGDEEDGFLLKLPAYTLWAPEGPAAMMLRPQGTDAVMFPLFTDFDAVLTYRRTQNIECMSIKEFKTASDLREYLTNPPLPKGVPIPETQYIIVDPMTHDQKYTLLDLKRVLKSLADAPDSQ